MHRSFRLLWASVGVSAFGNALTEVALPLLALLVVEASPTQLGAVIAVDQVAWLGLGLFAGVWVDRWPRRTVLILSDLGRGVLVAVLPVTYLLGGLSLGVLLVVGLLVGIGNVFAGTAAAAIVPEVVERQHLVRANARITTVDTATGLSGSAVVGPLVAVLGAPVALAVDAASFLASALLLRGLRTPRRVVDVAAPAPHFRRELVEGVRVVLTDPRFRALTLGTAAFNVCVAGQYVLGLLLLRELGTPVVLYGVLLAAAGVGALLGAALVSRLSAGWGEARVWRTAVVLGPVVGLLVPLTQPGPGLLAYVVGTAGLAAAVCVSSVIGFSLRQAVCPPALLGRVSATTRMITWGLIPAAAVGAGALGGLVGVRPALGVVAVLFFAEPLILRATRLWRWQGTIASVPRLT